MNDYPSDSPLETEEGKQGKYLLSQEELDKLGERDYALLLLSKLFPLRGIRHKNTDLDDLSWILRAMQARCEGQKKGGDE